MSEDVLDQVIAVLIAGDCECPLTDNKQDQAALTVNQRNARPVLTPLAHTLEIAFEEIGATNLQAFLHYLGSELVHAVLGSVTKYMIDRPAPVVRGPMLADVLDAPVAKLAVSYDIDILQYFFDARTLSEVSRVR